MCYLIITHDCTIFRITHYQAQSAKHTLEESPRTTFHGSLGSLLHISGSWRSGMDDKTVNEAIRMFTTKRTSLTSGAIVTEAGAISNDLYAFKSTQCRQIAKRFGKQATACHHQRQRLCGSIITSSLIKPERRIMACSLDFKLQFMRMCSPTYLITCIIVTHWTGKRNKRLHMHAYSRLDCARCLASVTEYVQICDTFGHACVSSSQN